MRASEQSGSGGDRISAQAAETAPCDWLNQVCAALGLFDGARPVSPQRVLWGEVLPTIEALKTNNPEAGVLVQENERAQRLWREALAKMVDANRRADRFLIRYNECEADRQSLLRRLRESPPQSHAEIQSPASGKAEPNQDDQARQSSSEKPLLDEIERLRDWNAALARQRDEAVEKGATDPARLTPLESGKAIGSANKQP
jgi:hypothetical protein